MSRFDSNKILTALGTSINIKNISLQILIAYIQRFLVKERSKLYGLQGISAHFKLI